MKQTRLNKELLSWCGLSNEADGDKIDIMRKTWGSMRLRSRDNHVLCAWQVDSLLKLEIPNMMNQYVLSKTSWEPLESARGPIAHATAAERIGKPDSGDGIECAALFPHSDGRARDAIASLGNLPAWIDTLSQ